MHSSAEKDVPVAGGCGDLADVLGIEQREGFFPAICCDSCHGDWDEGYDEPSDVQYQGRTYLVCCAPLRALDTHVTSPAKTSIDATEETP